MVLGKKFLNIILIALTLSLSSCFTSCGNKKKSGEGGVKPINERVQELDEEEDLAVLAVLNAYNQDSLYVQLKKNGQRRTYAYGEANDDGRIHGTLRKGDTYSILPQGKDVKVAINATELSGRWEYDAQQHRGMAFNDRGGMSSINNEDICFREWKLLNGKFYIYTVGQQDIAKDRHQYDVEEADITKLTPDELIIQFRGERYQCHRPSRTPVKL